MFTAYYDLSQCPTSFDIVSFLMLVERTRLERGEDKVDIQILPGPAEGFRRDHIWPYSTWERRNLLNRVVVPMCHSLPSVNSVAVLGERPDKVPHSIGHSEYSISFKEFCASYARGIRPLRAPNYGNDLKAKAKLVTITLRECEHWPERNSNFEEWKAAAVRLAKHGHSVLIIRDASKANEEIELASGPMDPVTYPEASVDLVIRGSVYRSAHVNLFINNGPAWFALALDAPTIIFRPVTETSCWAHTHEAMRGFGVIKDQQMKGAPEHQRLSWLPETADNIVKEVYNYFRTAVAA